MAGYETIAQKFRFNETLLTMVMDGFGPDDWTTQLGDANSAHWILGHVTHSRLYLLRGLGADLPEEPWEAIFAPGADTSKFDPATFPPTDELVTEFMAKGDQLSMHLDTLTEEGAAKEWVKLPDGTRTVGDGVHFFYMHEAYHLGQIGLVRRAVGRAGFV
jgi:uncharacterized damage-inducible protein DinB